MNATLFFVYAEKKKPCVHEINPSVYTFFPYETESVSFLPPLMVIFISQNSTINEKNGGVNENKKFTFSTGINQWQRIHIKKPKQCSVKWNLQCDHKEYEKYLEG
jgi:hypothetical protein